MIGSLQHLRVAGPSMEPTLFDGDLILYKKINTKKDNINIGDIVIAIHPNIKSKLIIKRIFYIYPNGLDLRGDNINSSTDSRHLGILEAEAIIGKVEKTIPR